MSEPVPDGFEWCDVRWPAVNKRGDHVCAEHTAGHAEHRCCCGDTNPYRPTLAATEGDRQ